MDKSYTYVLINGYTSTGSSAVTDLLSEYDTVYVPEKEFRLLKDPHGVIDLDRQLNMSTDLLNDDIAIREFIKFVRRYSKIGTPLTGRGLSYSKHFGSKLNDLADEYINKITERKYTGWWWYVSIYDTLPRVFFQRLRKLFGYDYRKHNEMRMVYSSEEQFINATKEFINNIFKNVVSEHEKDKEIRYIALDQPIPPGWPVYTKRYFEDAYNIIVERDPRSVYMDIITEYERNGDIVGHPGYDIAITHNVDLFIAWYKRYRMQNVKTEGKTLVVHFEDLILNYQRSVEMIERHIGIDEKKHKSPNTIFVPEKSKKNIYIWKDYQCPDEIKKIEHELREYLYKGL